MANKQPSPIDAFHNAISKAGGQVAFAKICGCTQGNIWQLKQKRSLLPAQYVLAVEAAELGFDRHDLRPDIYPSESAAA
jgi:DNA-binding transcriptional regulator YdaS (Cro superfamily)